jgi:hypothetical protein
MAACTSAWEQLAAALALPRDEKLEISDWTLEWLWMYGKNTT